MIINNLKELEEYGTLKLWDTVCFTVGEETIEYIVYTFFLNNQGLFPNCDNSKIFDLLEIDKYKLASEI